ncbi:hypothetical protein B0O99DRAFT_738803 [Bisporella sp. PMI_857]|nr:hypothetical protein B0O99DRAFT_738803 [Bisporella sp. PMI_857]
MAKKRSASYLARQKVKKAARKAAKKAVRRAAAAALPSTTVSGPLLPEHGSAPGSAPASLASSPSIFLSPPFASFSEEEEDDDDDDDDEPLVPLLRRSRAPRLPLARPVEEEEEEEEENAGRRVDPCLGCVRSALAGKSTGACYNRAGKAGGRCVRCSAGHSCVAAPAALLPVARRLSAALEATPVVKSRVNKLRGALRVLIEVEEEEGVLGGASRQRLAELCHRAVDVALSQL